jgi:hypothetical protein
MTTKEKIALHGLMQKVQRGIYTEEQAKEAFEKITGRKPDEVPAEDDQEGQELGKFLDSLNASLEAAAQAKEEAETEQNDLTVDLNPLTDKLAKRRPAGKAPKVVKAV